jgi:tRNA wybutosine-synthesizing protein 4
VVNHQGCTFILGGIIKNEILDESTEVCFLDTEGKVSQAILSRVPSSAPRPLLIGLSVISTGSSLLIMGGSAICFSFGTFWNSGCYTLRRSPVESPNGIWRFLHTVDATKPAGLPVEHPHPTTLNAMTSVPRIRIESSANFEQILRSAKPVILEGLDVGPCTTRWTMSYLLEQVGAERKVSFIHSVCSMIYN